MLAWSAITRRACAVAVVLVPGTRVCAEPVACYTIQPGDTAAFISLRLTGSVHDKDQPWFRIVVPARSTVVPKSEYARIRPGWRACVPESRLTVEWRGAFDHAIPTGPQATGGDKWTFAIVGRGIAWCGAAILTLMALAYLMWRYLNRRQAITRHMRRFGEQFIREFERPLIQPGAVDRPLEARLRVIPRRRRVEILLAPKGGRRYPNLSDHRGNVRYDIERVLRTLREDGVADGELSADGRWVVVACRFKAGSHQEGAL